MTETYVVLCVMYHIHVHMVQALNNIIKFKFQFLKFVYHKWG